MQKVDDNKIRKNFGIATAKNNRYVLIFGGYSHGPGG